jgi:hypothetical protein
MATLSRPITLLVVLLATSCDGPEAPGSKSEWSVLQGVEYDHRNTPVSSPVVLAVSGYRVAGLPRSDGPGSVWVLLDPHQAPYYKQLPGGSYRLSSSQLATLSVSQPVVLAGLRKHVRE